MHWLLDRATQLTNLKRENQTSAPEPTLSHTTASPTAWRALATVRCHLTGRATLVGTTATVRAATAFLIIMAMTFGLILPRMLFERVVPSPHDKARSFNAPQRHPRIARSRLSMLIGRLALETVGTSMTTILTRSFPEEKPPAGKAVPGKKRVLIVGGGFAGIAAARALKRADVEITLVDRRNHHIFQPLLYQVATAVLAPSEIAAPIRQLEAKQKNLSVLLAEVKGINLGARTVEVVCPGIGSRKLEYDFLVIATGMRPSYFGHDEFARFAPGLKSLNDAETIRTKILSAFELAEIDR